MSANRATGRLRRSSCTSSIAGDLYQCLPNGYFLVFSMILAFSLCGCVLRGKQQAKVVTPPPPAPVAPSAPPPPQPLSIPQTQTELPPPQPISAAALATIQSPAQSPEPQPGPGAPARPARRPVGPPAGPPPSVSSVPAQPAPAGAVTPTPGATTAEGEPREAVQEIVPADEQKRLQDSVAARKVDIRKVLEAAAKRRLTHEQRNVVARINSFLTQSDEAEKRGDWRQADALAERAQVLAKELSSGNQ